MKRFTLTTAVAAVAITSFATFAAAADYNTYRRDATNTPRIDATQTQQAREIERGVRSGKLTWREYFGLKREQATIDRMEARAKADGVVTEKERRQIRDAQTDAQKHIFKETHDAETRGTQTRRWWSWN